MHANQACSPIKNMQSREDERSNGDVDHDYANDRCAGPENGPGKAMGLVWRPPWGVTLPSSCRALGKGLIPSIG